MNRQPEPCVRSQFWEEHDINSLFFECWVWLINSVDQKCVTDDTFVMPYYVTFTLNDEQDPHLTSDASIFTVSADSILNLCLPYIDSWRHDNTISVDQDVVQHSDFLETKKEKILLDKHFTTHDKTKHLFNSCTKESVENVDSLSVIEMKLRRTIMGLLYGTLMYSQSSKLLLDTYPKDVNYSQSVTLNTCPSIIYFIPSRKSMSLIPTDREIPEFQKFNELLVCLELILVQLDSIRITPLKKIGLSTVVLVINSFSLNFKLFTFFCQQIMLNQLLPWAMTLTTLLKHYQLLFSIEETTLLVDDSIPLSCLDLSLNGFLEMIIIRLICCLKTSTFTDKDNLKLIQLMCHLFLRPRYLCWLATGFTETMSIVRSKDICLHCHHVSPGCFSASLMSSFEPTHSSDLPEFKTSSSSSLRVFLVSFIFLKLLCWVKIDGLFIHQLLSITRHQPSLVDTKHTTESYYDPSRILTGSSSSSSNGLSEDAVAARHVAIELLLRLWNFTLYDDHVESYIFRSSICLLLGRLFISKLSDIGKISSIQPILECLSHPCPILWWGIIELSYQNITLHECKQLFKKNVSHQSLTLNSWNSVYLCQLWTILNLLHRSNINQCFFLQMISDDITTTLYHSLGLEYISNPTLHQMSQYHPYQFKPLKTHGFNISVDSISSQSDAASFPIIFSTLLSIPIASEFSLLLLDPIILQRLSFLISEVNLSPLKYYMYWFQMDLNPLLNTLTHDCSYFNQVPLILSVLKYLSQQNVSHQQQNKTHHMISEHLSLHQHHSIASDTWDNHLFYVNPKHSCPTSLSETHTSTTTTEILKGLGIQELTRQLIMAAEFHHGVVSLSPTLLAQIRRTLFDQWCFHYYSPILDWDIMNHQQQQQNPIIDVASHHQSDCLIKTNDLTTFDMTSDRTALEAVSNTTRIEDAVNNTICSINYPTDIISDIDTTSETALPLLITPCNSANGYNSLLSDQTPITQSLVMSSQPLFRFTDIPEWALLMILQQLTLPTNLFITNHTMQQLKYSYRVPDMIGDWLWELMTVTTQETNDMFSAQLNNKTLEQLVKEGVVIPSNKLSVHPLSISLLYFLCLFIDKWYNVLGNGFLVSVGLSFVNYSLFQLQKNNQLPHFDAFTLDLLKQCNTLSDLKNVSPLITKYYISLCKQTLIGRLLIMAGIEPQTLFFNHSTIHYKNSTDNNMSADNQHNDTCIKNRRLLYSNSVACKHLKFPLVGCTVIEEDLQLLHPPFTIHTRFPLNELLIHVLSEMFCFLMFTIPHYWPEERFLALQKKTTL